jgi:ABC-type sulfate transport system permease subunit
MPLHIEILYNEYQFAPAFAVASLLALLALVTLFVKSGVEWKARQHSELQEQEILTARPIATRTAIVNSGVKAA